MAFLTMRLLVTERSFPVVATASAAKPARAVGLLGNLGSICLHVELQLVMADPTGMPSPVKPMGEGGGLDPISGRGSVNQDVAVFLRRRAGREFPVAECRNRNDETDQ